MRIADIKLNDIVDIDSGIAISIWFQGCPFHCSECHNPGTWDFNGGQEIDIQDVIKTILDNLNASNINRDLSLLGGEPLCPENRKNALEIIEAVKEKYPKVRIFCWTGYVYENLLKEKDETIIKIFEKIDYLIDGPYVNNERNIMLILRGSTNQRIIDMQKTNKEKKLVLKNK